MLQLNRIDFRYPTGDFHLSIPDLSVKTGEKVGVIGPSGSGKTTLLNLVAGIITPGKGNVTVDEMEISSQNDTTRRDFRITNIGFIFQDFGLLDYLTILDNILHPYRITDALKLTKEIRNKAYKLAEQMGIADKLNRHPTDLSHGERQRVAICRALLPGPKIILADEATGNLDPKNKLRILELLFESAEKHGATILAVTHDQELLPHFDRVVNFQDFVLGESV
jgi:putative ABC transport system ATP-binding protein